MIRSKLVVLLLLVTTFMGHAQTYEWSSVVMDGSRTGCTPLAINNLEGTLGVFLEDGTYIAPNGRIYAAGSLTARTAAIVRDAQEPMKRVKTVIFRNLCCQFFINMCCKPFFSAHQSFPLCPCRSIAADNSVREADFCGKTGFFLRCRNQRTGPAFGKA